MKLSTKCKVRLNIVISISIEMLHLDFKWRVHAKKDPQIFFSWRNFRVFQNCSCCQRLLSNDARCAKEVIFLLMTVLALGEMGVFIFSTVEYCISWYFCWLNVLKVSLSIKHTLSVSVGAFPKRIKYLLLLIKAELLVDPTGMKTWMGQQKETISIKLNTVRFLLSLNKLILIAFYLPYFRWTFLSSYPMLSCFVRLSMGFNFLMFYSEKRKYDEGP